MTTHGADPDALEAFGTTLKNQIQTVEQMIRAIDGPLNSLPWTGPARDHFKTEWDTTFKSALTKLNTAFENAGTNCQQVAQGTRQVLGRGA